MLQTKDDFLGRQMLHFNFHGPPNYPLVVGVCTVSNGKMESTFKTIWFQNHSQGRIRG